MNRGAGKCERRMIATETHDDARGAVTLTQVPVPGRAGALGRCSPSARDALGGLEGQEVLGGNAPQGTAVQTPLRGFTYSFN